MAQWHVWRRAKALHPGDDEVPIRFELFSTDRLEEHAISLARVQKVSRHKDGRALLPRLSENARVLLDAYTAVALAVREQRAIPPAAEWLLDNFHIIKQQVSRSSPLRDLILSPGGQYLSL